MSLAAASKHENFGVRNGGVQVRTTLALDDELIAKAQELTGLKEKLSLMMWARPVTRYCDAAIDRASEWSSEGVRLKIHHKGH